MPNFEILLRTLQEHGYEDLDQHISLHPGVPLKPMLAHPTKDMSEIFKRFGNGCKFAAEYKVKLSYLFSNLLITLSAEYVVEAFRKNLKFQLKF